MGLVCGGEGRMILCVQRVDLVRVFVGVRPAEETYSVGTFFYTSPEVLTPREFYDNPWMLCSSNELTKIND